MKITNDHIYYVYIVTNKNKTVLYTGITNDLSNRLDEHYENSKPFRHPSFAGKYNASFLIYYEQFVDVKEAITREKEIKGWRREKKESLVPRDDSYFGAFEITSTLFFLPIKVFLTLIKFHTHAG